MPSHRGLFVGAGGAGGSTLTDFGRLAGTVIAAVVDPSPAAARRLELPAGIPVFADLGEALTRIDADVAFISSPSNEHARQFIACAESGMHVWVEKPIALSLGDALAMKAAADKAGIKSVTPFASYVHFYLSDAVELARSGKIGPVVQIEAINTGSYGYARESPDVHYAIRKPEVSGGWIFHHFSHLVDWATQIGGPVESVFCQTETTFPNPKPHQEEAITAIFRFSSGGSATLLENQLRHIHLRYSVMGERGAQFITASPESRGNDPFLSIETAFGQDASRQVFDYDAYMNASAQRPSAVRRFLDAIDNNVPSPVPLERAIENIEICLALRESARSGAAVRVSHAQGKS